MERREYRQHDRHGDQCRARNDDEQHIGDETQGEDDEQRRRQFSVGSQQRQNWKGQRHRAQREFLTLIDIVFDEDSSAGIIGAPHNIGLERQTWLEKNQPGYRQQQRAGHQKGNEHPRAARRTLEVIKQQWQHQQFHGRAHRMEAYAPCRVRPQCPDQRQRKERDRQGANRVRQRPRECAQIQRRNQCDNPKCGGNRDAGRRPRQHNRDENRQQIDAEAPRRRIAAMRRERPRAGITPGSRLAASVIPESLLDPCALIAKA